MVNSGIILCAAVCYRTPGIRHLSLLKDAFAPGSASVTKCSNDLCLRLKSPLAFRKQGRMYCLCSFIFLPFPKPSDFVIIQCPWLSLLAREIDEAVNLIIWQQRSLPSLWWDGAGVRCLSALLFTLGWRCYCCGWLGIILSFVVF